MLAAEQRRFAELFRGTPVVFSTQSDGSLRVELPLQYCFDAARSSVKPPLAAVLERLARSQQNEYTRLVVTAPADPNAKALALGTERAASARDYLVARGVALDRLSISAVARGPVRVVVADATVP